MLATVIDPTTAEAANEDPWKLVDARRGWTPRSGAVSVVTRWADSTGTAGPALNRIGGEGETTRGFAETEAVT
ncbi:MAG: hypothetical protein ACRBN8_14780 [Nannocystales bacterium]